MSQRVVVVGGGVVGACSAYYLARAGFAVRLRQKGGETIVSVKSLAHTDGPGGALSREELEGPADRVAPPSDWPASDARALVLEHAGDAVGRGLRHRVPEAPAALARGCGGVAVARGRRDVDDGAAAGGGHRGDEVAVEHQLRDRVGEQLLLDQLDRGVEQAVHVAGADVATVVHHDVDGAPPVEDAPMKSDAGDQESPKTWLRGGRPSSEYHVASPGTRRSR